ncbi:cytochrome P450 3A29-like [Macrobrachium rosenbergii]|uniref:cytochrome P450 3A29-like n=1 Tax=Macrobrachium rosenbergii TaxID=79674 RepID=UPI0034D460C3
MILEMLSSLWSLLCVGMTQYTKTFCFATIILYVIHWVRVRRYKHSLFQRLGIPYVKPHLIHGSMRTLTGKTVATEVIGKWLEKYGNIFGYYIGAKPTVVVKDLDLIRQVLVKDFHNFSNRPKFLVEVEPIINTLVGLRDQRWKDVRSILTPTFSMSKMKLMIGIINERVSELLEIVSDRNAAEKPLEWYSMFQGLTLDVICEAVLAMKRHCQRDQDNDLVLSSTRKFLRNAINPVVHLLNYFNIFLSVLAFVYNTFALSGRMTNMIVTHLKTVLEVRREDLSKKHIDVLQLMLDAAESRHVSDTKVLNIQNGTSVPNGKINEARQQHSASNSILANEVAKKTMSDKEIIANAWMFLIAGFDTTANSLTNTAYLLACNPDIQEKLYLELCEHIEDGHKHISYETVHKLTYLDQVFSETLRLFPPVVTFITRDTNADYQLGDYFIPTDTNIMIPVWQIHHDPKLWPEPYTFDPERFSAEAKASENRHPMSYIPFGAGPRSCPGLRFAQLEAKVALARLIRTHKLETCEQTPIPMVFELPTVTHTPAKDVILKAIPRE